MTEDLARLRLIETAARDLLPTLESYSGDIDLIDFRAALRATPVADTAGIDAAWREALRLVDAAIFDLPIGNDVTYSRGYSAGIAAARESLRESLRAAALRTPKPEGEPE